MCLYIRDKNPRIAKEDIVVLKYLRKENEQFYSPCQDTPVTLGKILVASPKEPSITFSSIDAFDRKISELNGGAIHARLFEGLNGIGYSNYCAKAVIPKGTKYWIDPFGTEIAAEKMLITEEVGGDEVIDDSFAKEILASAPEVNDIRIGDYQMTDNSFVHPKKSMEETKVRGIVCGFYENGEPIICALEMFEEIWDSKITSKIGEYTTSPAKAMKLFNGKDVTRKYIQAADYSRIKKWNCESRFGAFERCINYRKDKGEEWFFGALREITTLLDNTIYLNAAHKITGLGFIIKTDYPHWSCSEYNYAHTWICGLGCGKVRHGHARKGNIFRFVPFYASAKKCNKQEK